MLLDSFANGDAACYHCFVVSEVKDEQVALVSKHFGDCKGALLTDAAVS